MLRLRRTFITSARILRDQTSPAVVSSGSTTVSTPLNSASPPPPRSTPKKTSFASRLIAFISGVALTSVGGYFLLYNDIWQSSSAVASRVIALHADVVTMDRNFRSELGTLQARVAKLEQSGAAPVAAPSDNVSEVAQTAPATVPVPPPEPNASELAVEKKS